MAIQPNVNIQQQTQQLPPYTPPGPITKAYRDLLDVLDKIPQKVGTLPDKIWDQTVKNAEGAFDRLGKALGNIGGKTIDRLSDTLESFFEKGFSTGKFDWKALGKGIGGAFTSILDDIKSAALDSLKDLIRAPLNALNDVLKTEIFDPLKEKLGNLISTTFKEGLKGLGDVLDDVWQSVSKAVEGVWDWISSGFDQGGIFGAGGFFSDILDAIFHSGGVAGEGGASRPGSVFNLQGAPRYHVGGIAGLRPNEIPAVLLRGEEVLTRRDPRHRYNLASVGARSLGSPAMNDNRMPAAVGQNVKITYNIDARGADAGVEARIRVAMRETEQRTLTAVNDLANRGGPYAKTLGRRQQ